MNNIKIKLKTSELTGAALDWAVAMLTNVGEDSKENEPNTITSTDWDELGRSLSVV
jgi:hypothetical protein